MSLAPGTRLGPYEIVAHIGGGMGEVYCARDSKLQREIAIKVLPQALAHDNERLARFEREARTLGFRSCVDPRWERDHLQGQPWAHHGGRGAQSRQ